MTEDLAAWFDRLSDGPRAIDLDPHGLVTERARELAEAFEWGLPCYSGKALGCHIQRAKTRVSLGFGQSAALAATHPGPDGDGGQMRHVKIPLGAAPDHLRLIDAAVTLNAKG